jgi:hypothetical protein
MSARVIEERRGFLGALGAVGGHVGAPRVENP